MSSPRPFSLLVVDPNPGFREALRMLISVEAPECELVAEIEHGIQAAETVRRLRPDVVLVERVLPDGSALDLVRDLHEASPSARVVLICVDWDRPTVEAALEAGASGVVPKHAAADCLVPALRRVLDGDVVDPCQGPGG